MTIAALVAVTSGVAAQTQKNWTEDDEWEMIGKTFPLEQETTKRVHENTKVQTELQRIGLAAACPVAKEAIKRNVANFSDEYRELAIRGLRVEYDLAETYTDQFLLVPNGAKASVLRRRLILMDGAFFDSVEAETLNAVVQKLGTLPDGSNDWRGRFSDWDFRQGFGQVFQMACLVETSSKPEATKLAFDGFYKRRK